MCFYFMVFDVIACVFTLVWLMFAVVLALC